MQVKNLEINNETIMFKIGNSFHSISNNGFKEFLGALTYDKGKDNINLTVVYDAYDDNDDYIKNEFCSFKNETLSKMFKILDEYSLKSHKDKIDFNNKFNTRMFAYSTGGLDDDEIIFSLNREEIQTNKNGIKYYNVDKELELIVKRCQKIIETLEKEKKLNNKIDKKITAKQEPKLKK